MQGLIKHTEKQVTVNTPHTECLGSAPITSLCVYKETPYEVEIETKWRKGKLVKTKRELVDNSRLFDFLSIQIIEAFQFYGKETTPAMVKELCQLIFETYYFLKIDEIRLFFKQMKSGKWKQMHNFSPAVLMERIAEFANESIEIRIMQGEKEEQTIKFEDVLTDQQLASIADLAEQLSKKYDKKPTSEQMHEARVRYFKEQINKDEAHGA